MISPRDPQMERNSEVCHDDRPDSAHEEEVKKAGGQSVKAEDANEGSSESTYQEKEAEDDED